MKKSVGFIGGGRVTRILLRGFNNKNAPFGRIIVADTNKETADNLKKSFPDILVDNASAAASQDIVFIALHPPVVLDTLEMVKESFNVNSIVISLAPKITISRISSKLNQVRNLARMIPNATSYINEGYNPVSFSPAFVGNIKQEILCRLRLLGNTFEVPEEKLESYAIMSAMLPTYFWFQWKTLAEIGQKIGLSEKESNEAINNTLIASLKLMFESGLPLDEIMDLIPVKPLGEHEPIIEEIFRTRLIGLFEKIKPREI